MYKKSVKGLGLNVVLTVQVSMGVPVLYVYVCTPVCYRQVGRGVCLVYLPSFVSHFHPPPPAPSPLCLTAGTSEAY